MRTKIIKIAMIQQIFDQQEALRLEQIRLRVRDEGIEPLRKKKEQRDKIFILNCLKHHFIFSHLSEKELDNIKEHMFWVKMPEGTEIFRQGTIGSCFFIIERGSIDMQVDGQKTKTLKANEGFGQLALVHGLERVGTAVTNSFCSFWVIDKVSCRLAVQEIMLGEWQATQKLLQSIAFYQFLKSQQKEKVAAAFVTLRYHKGQNIIQEGDPGSSFYLIKKGTAALIRGNVEERKLYKGESFGHHSLYYNTMRKMTVQAEEEVVCQVLGRATLAEIIGRDFREVMFRNYAKHVIQKHKKLYSIMRKDEEAFFEGMRVLYKRNNEVVFYKGKTVERLLVLMEGRLKKYRAEHALVETGQIWGESYLSEGFNNRLEDDIIVDVESIIIDLDLLKIKAIKDSHESILTDKSEEVIRQKEFDMGDVHFLYEWDKTVESSIVMLRYAERRLVGKLYHKHEAQLNNTMQIVNQEMEVTKMAQHPFLPAFFSIVDHPRHVLKITELVEGESLYDTIRQIGLLSSAATQFFAASIILLLQYFMTKSIVVRDLKPDNFIVDEDGYLMLISLGSAKCITSHRTNTLIGTPHYMAPEIILGKEYNELVDVWSTGVMLFEFMVGQLPFGGNTENPYEIYKSVVEGDVDFPRNFKDRRAKKIIETMLNSNPEARCPGSYSSLKANPWFQGINWYDLGNRNVKPPYRPSRLREIRTVSGSTKLESYLQNL